jgi:hypothetical protein
MMSSRLRAEAVSIEAANPVIPMATKAAVNIDFSMSKPLWRLQAIEENQSVLRHPTAALEVFLYTVCARMAFIIDQDHYEVSTRWRGFRSVCAKQREVDRRLCPKIKSLFVE